VKIALRVYRTRNFAGCLAPSPSAGKRTLTVDDRRVSLHNPWGIGSCCQRSDVMEAAIAGLFIMALCVVGALIPARHEIIPR
jgi:hypothetical protein